MCRYILIFLLFVSAMAAAAEDQVLIYVNGGSSVGKTTFARRLQERFEKPLLYVGIDWVIEMMPEKMNDFHAEKQGNFPGFSWKRSIDENGQEQIENIIIGPYALKILQTYKELVSFLADRGHSLIIDDVSVGENQVNLWRENLAGHQVIYVGLTAPAEVIAEREKKRGDRMLGVAVKIAPLVHQGVEYDLLLDTHKQTLDQNVDQVLALIKQRCGQ